MTRLPLALVLVVSVAACRDCEDLGSLAPQGSIEPNIFDFGPLTPGQECQAVLKVRNSGRTDLDVNGGTLTNVDGDWTLARVPTLVELGAEEDLIIEYVVAGASGDRQSAGIEVNTDDPDDDGVLHGQITALIADAAGPTARTSCPGSEEEDPPRCATLEFGATQVNGAGTVASVTVTNDGTADLNIAAAVINLGNADFVVESVRRGTTLLETPPYVVLAGRSTDCGAPSGNDNTVTIDVRYTPSQVGDDVDELVILSDSLESDGRLVNPGEIKVPLHGGGSDIGIFINPPVINFGELAEGQTQSIDAHVFNFGTATASVNISCIDLENDGTCEARCTGAPADTAFNGTLSCDVTYVDGSNEGDGFVLAPTDALNGGDDERIVTVTWAPIAGSTQLPPSAVLALESNILGDETFTAQILGNAIGVITPSVASGDDTCPASPPANACLVATGTAGDHTTWAGEITLRLTNTGNATVTITDVALEGASTITDDYTVAPITDAALAPNESGDIVIAYDEVGTNADVAPSSQLVNVIVTHTGAGGTTTVTLDVIPPS